MRELQSLLGLMNFAAKVIVPGRAFMRRMYDLTRGLRSQRQHVRLNKEAKADIGAWSEFLQGYNRSSLFLDNAWVSSNTLHLYTNAASSGGYAAVLGSNWFAGAWPESWRSHNIALLELYPIVVAVQLWGQKWKNHCILFLCDNEAIVAVINKQTCLDVYIMVLVRELVMSCLKYNILFKAKHIPGKTNIVADLLSRLQVLKARQVAPWLSPVPTTLPPHLLPCP